MQKIDGIDKVRVSLNEGLTILDLKADNAVTLSTVRQIIKNNGFVSKEATVVARGTIANVDGQSTFEVSGTRERLLTTAEPQRSGEEWRFTVPAPKK
jgi:hypothetical protein